MQTRDSTLAKNVRWAKNLDWALATLATLALMGGAGIAFFWSGFFVMATDSCYDRCRTGYLSWAYAVTWSGIAASLLVAFAGMFVAETRTKVRVVWPLAGIAILVVTFVIGADFANAAMGH